LLKRIDENRTVSMMNSFVLLSMAKRKWIFSNDVDEFHYNVWQDHEYFSTKIREFFHRYLLKYVEDIDDCIAKAKKKKNEIVFIRIRNNHSHFSRDTSFWSMNLNWTVDLRKRRIDWMMWWFLFYMLGFLTIIHLNIKFSSIWTCIMKCSIRNAMPIRLTI